MHQRKLCPCKQHSIEPPLPVYGECYRAAPKRLITGWAIAVDSRDLHEIRRARNALVGFAVKRQRRSAGNKRA